MEIALVVVTLALAVLAIGAATREAPRLRARVIALLVVGSCVSAALLRPRARAAPPPARPGADERSPYVSSAACLGCHPGEHASFARTFHKKMTQDATPETVLAPLVPPFERRGDEVWADGKRVVLTTGSHREQAYWVAGRRAGELALLPFVWMVRDARLVARAEAFLTPPDAPLGETHWGSNCIACHAVAGQPRHDPLRDAFDTRVGELGVACEACHGPGAAHVSRHRDPVERYVQHASKAADPTIVHPGRLPPERSAAICGQCHAYAYPRDEDEWWSRGYSRTFKAGDALEPSRYLLGPDTMGKPGMPRIEAAVASLFWDDGTIRVGGREYNAIVASKCKATCLSCHAMHQGDPAGQIAPERVGDRACTTCHASASYGAAHTHHRDGSPGAACVGCHMPKTSYALLSAVRAHRIDRPSAASTLATGRPNACNLCHLDRSLAWTAERLADWYRTPPLAVEGRRRDVAEGVFGALAGDAAVRVLVADALGSPEAIAATGRSWQAPLLAELARDPYAAVRFVAERSRKAVDPAAPPLDPALLQALLAARDQHAITIAE